MIDMYWSAVAILKNRPEATVEVTMLVRRWVKRVGITRLRLGTHLPCPAATMRNLNTMADAVADAYDAMIANLTAAHKGELTDIANAYNAEERLNSLRNNLRDAMIEDIEDGTNNYQTSVYYMDIINQYERMGDFMINISQDLERAFVKR